MTVVLINAGRSALAVQLDPGTSNTATTQVVRTVFDGEERTLDLGSLPPEHIVQIPERSVVTVVFGTQN